MQHGFSSGRKTSDILNLFHHISLHLHTQPACAVVNQEIVRNNLIRFFFLYLEPGIRFSVNRPKDTDTIVFVRQVRLSRSKGQGIDSHVQQGRMQIHHLKIFCQFLRRLNPRPAGILILLQQSDGKGIPSGPKLYKALCQL